MVTGPGQSLFRRAAVEVEPLEKARDMNIPMREIRYHWCVNIEAQALGGQCLRFCICVKVIVL